MSTSTLHTQIEKEQAKIATAKKRITELQSKIDADGEKEALKLAKWFLASGKPMDEIKSLVDAKPAAPKMLYKPAAASAATTTTPSEFKSYLDELDEASKLQEESK